MKRLALLAAALVLWPVLSLAQLTTLGVGGASVAASAFGITFIGSAVDATNCASGICTFTAQGVGTDTGAPNHRWTVVAVGAGAGSPVDVSSMTICGLSATEAATDISDFVATSIFYADTTGQGTTCNIVTTFSGGTSNEAVGIWRMINPISSTPTAATCATGASSVVTLSINVSAGGSAVAYALSAFNTNRTWTWVGPTEDFDATVENVLNTHSGAHGGASGSPLTITATASGSTFNSAGCSASWAP